MLSHLVHLLFYQILIDNIFQFYIYVNLDRILNCMTVLILKHLQKMFHLNDLHPINR